jgi:HPt (histidine-containing phosphotransfer) domain-containing protein
VTDGFEGRLAALRRRFLDRATTESEALEELASDLDSGAQRAHARQQIRRIAHGLAGAGGTFGFARISNYAVELEEFVSDVPDSPDLADACRTLIAEIRSTA